MVENLLHANVALSNEQYQSLYSIHPMYRVPKEIGVITFLGVSGYTSRDTVHLLIRLESFVVHEMAMITTVIERVFGEKYVMVLGGDFATTFNSHLPRTIVTTTLRNPLRNPKRYIRKQAKIFAREIVNYQHEKIRVHKEEEEEDWQNIGKFQLPEQA